MPAEISIVQVDVPIDPPKRRKHAGACSVILELDTAGCRVWDSVDYTDCSESYNFTEPTNPVLASKPLTDMPYFNEVFKHLTNEYAIHRKNPLGDFLRHAVTAMQAALAAKQGFCVYFAQAGDRIKIGWSKNVATRVAQLQTGNAAPIKLLGVVPGGRAKEREIHDLFASVRVGGEWFTATTELLAYIRKEAQAT